MDRTDREKLIHAIGMLEGLSWVVEEKCDSSIEMIWIIIDELESILDNSEEE